MQNIIETDDLISIGFDSMSDMLAFENALPSYHRGRRFLEMYKAKKNRDRGDWFGLTNATGADVFDHALLGDEKMLERLESKYIAELNRITKQETSSYIQHIKAVRRQRKFADQGDELDMDKVYAGNLDTCWSKTERIETDKDHHLITIAIHIGGNCNVNAEDSLWRGAVAVRLVKELEAAGKNVRLILVAFSENVYEETNKKVSQFMVVKEMNERLSMQKLAAMSHLGFFRTAFFTMFGFSKYTPRESLGHSVPYEEKLIPEQMKKEIAAGHMRWILIPQCVSVIDAEIALNKIYAELGGAK